jgi:DNA polymerase III delta prime subunit
MNKEKDYSFPNQNDEDFNFKIFKKREFNYHSVPRRKELKNYQDVQNYRANTCKNNDERIPTSQQIIAPNFINLNTPYKGILLFYGTGTGKTEAAIRIAEQFKDQVKKYNTKIYILLPGENTRINFKNELITSTGETYLKNKDSLNQLSKYEVEKIKKQAIYSALQYYKILSYKTFHKKVLGEKIIEKKLINNNKIKSTYKKNSEGEIERELVVDRITQMNNTIIIVDEAHNITGNEFGDSLKKIIKNSENLRVVLLTATPMINYADEIVDLLNFLRPLNDQIQRDKIFTSEKNYNMKIKEGGIEYLQDKARGYVSYYRGAIPYTYAKRVEKGVIPNGMLFTPVIKCFMELFQYKTYEKVIKNTNVTEIIDKSSYFIFPGTNFVFPGLNKDKTDIIGYYSNDGVVTVLSHINNDGPKLRELINKKIFNNKLSKDEENNIIYENNKKNISGLLLKLPYVKNFSIKFYKLINRLFKLIDGKKGASTAFIYSNFVESGGIKLFAESLIQNGYLEYDENYFNYDIKDETIDYKTGLTYLEFKKKYNISNFRPATYILLTGSSDDTDDIPEVKQRLIRDVFNNYDNIDGKNIKLVLGSRVMNEGVTLKNCKHVHMLDVFFNIPKLEQVIGRIIRMCVHKDLINNNYKYPKVYVYRYVVALNNKKSNELSTDEILYQKAELKYLTVKNIERVLKEIAFDCPLLINANKFPEEIEKYKDCVEPTLENIQQKKKICPALCDFKSCNLKCKSNQLDKLWNGYDYKKLKKSDLDYNTFNDELAKFEINLIKIYIKDLYKFKYVYLYNEIKDEILKSFTQEQAELFDDYFLDQALEDIMPKNENDFNTFNDTIYDKYNRSGYIIQRGKYYIFQPFNENEDVSMYYRQHLIFDQTNQVSLNNYIKQNYDISKYKTIDNLDDNVNKYIYNYELTLDYYNNRDENFVIGIIDKNTNKLASNTIDLFKIREPLKKMKLKRGIGIPTLKGAVCTTKDKSYLINILNEINKINDKMNIKYNFSINKLSKNDICTKLKNILLYLEKYSTSELNNKITYMIIPYNHPVYKFPYNLEDRIKYYIKIVNKLADRNIDIIVEKEQNGSFLEEINKLYPKYKLIFNNDKYLSNNIEDLKKYGFELKNNKWFLIID